MCFMNASIFLFIPPQKDSNCKQLFWSNRGNREKRACLDIEATDTDWDGCLLSLVNSKVEPLLLPTATWQQWQGLLFVFVAVAALLDVAAPTVAFTIVVAFATATVTAASAAPFPSPVCHGPAHLSLMDKQNSNY